VNLRSSRGLCGFYRREIAAALAFETLALAAVYARYSLKLTAANHSRFLLRFQERLLTPGPALPGQEAEKKCKRRSEI
jgi:hypothetical protein